MKSTSFITVALATCTAYVLPAAKAAPSSWQSNALLAKTVACVIGTDNRAIVGFHQLLSADPILYPKGPAFGNHFGFAIVTTNPSTAAALHDSKTLFDQKYKRSHFFKVDDTQALDFETLGFTRELHIHTAIQCMAKRYVLLCAHTPKNLGVKKIVEKAVEKDQPELDLAAMLAFVKEQLPNATFVLFDAATYQAERAMYHIPEATRTMLTHAAFARKKSPSGKLPSKHKKSTSIC